ncbi:MAG: hypothetical protein VX076_11195 [Pseudomonadota bacterium]|nr:hypothetical protein [Pseudomonadota bacterium]
MLLVKIIAVFGQFTNTIKVALSLRFTHHLHSIISTAFFHRYDNKN